MIYACRYNIFKYPKNMLCETYGWNNRYTQHMFKEQSYVGYKNIDNIGVPMLHVEHPHNKYIDICIELSEGDQFEVAYPPAIATITNYTILKIDGDKVTYIESDAAIYQANIWQRVMYALQKKLHEWWTIEDLLEMCRTK